MIVDDSAVLLFIIVSLKVRQPEETGLQQDTVSFDRSVFHAVLTTAAVPIYIIQLIHGTATQQAAAIAADNTVTVLQLMRMCSG
jgi:hypothetical protein